MLSYPSLLAEFQARLPDTTPEDASSVCEALAASGAILRQGNLVYLRPDEVLDALRRVLPVDEASLRARLAEAEAELEVLQRQRTAIHRSARLRSRVMNYAVLGAMLAQWGLLFRLTYWELSWDVVEPIGFFAGGATSVASCAYFVRTRRDFTYEAMYNSFLSSYEVCETGRVSFTCTLLGSMFMFFCVGEEVSQANSRLRVRNACQLCRSGHLKTPSSIFKSTIGCKRRSRG